MLLLIPECDVIKKEMFAANVSNKSSQTATNEILQ